MALHLVLSTDDLRMTSTVNIPFTGNAVAVLSTHHLYDTAMVPCNGQLANQSISVESSRVESNRERTDNARRAAYIDSLFI